MQIEKWIGEMGKAPFSDCPECEEPVEFYGTAEDGRSGRYRCTYCGRDTEWAIGKAQSLSDKLKTRPLCVCGCPLESHANGAAMQRCYDCGCPRYEQR